MSVSGLPKLDDFKKAIAEVKAANAKYTTAQNSLKPSQEAIDKAKAALDAAKDKYNSLQNDYNNKSYLNNSTYQSAYNTYQDALSKANSLENYWRSRDWLKSDSNYQNAANTYNTLKDSIDSGRYLQNNSAYQTAANNLIAAQQKLETAKNYLNSEDYLNKNSTYQNLLSARQTAEQKLNEARDFYDSGRYYRDNSTYNNYVNAFNEADRKLNDLRNWKDSGRYLEENSTYKNAVNAIPSKEDALRAAESKLDNWSGARSGSAWNSAVAAKVAADTALVNARTAADKAAEAASNAADTLIRNQDTTRSTAEQNVNKTRESLEVAANKARETAENTYNSVRDNIDRTRDSLRQTAENAVNTAQSSYENLQPAVDKAKEVATNAARTALGTAETNKNIAENKADELAWNNWQTSARAADTLNTKANDIAKGLEATANKAVEAQKSAVDSQNGIYETAQNKYNDIYGQIKPDFEDYNAKLANVSNYAQVFKENVGDITQTADATAAKKLLDQFNAEIKNSGVPELQEKVAPLFSGINPTNKVTPIAIQGANAGYFSNIDSKTGLPILDQTALDKVLAKYGGNSLNSGQYRDNYNAFGWNVKSDGSSVLRGSDIFGVVKVTNPMGGEVWYKGDMNNAAKQLGIDISGLKTDEEKYKAINEASKDLYLVSNALDRTGISANNAAPHASVLFKSDGSGNLVPVVDQGGKVVSQQYNAVPVTHAGWQGQLAELAPLIQMASLAFAPQLGNMLNSAIGGMQVSAAVAPTAFTMGLPAVTLAQTIGATGVSMIAGAVQNAVTSGLMGGDIGQAALTGAVAPAMSGNANKILDNVGIGQDSINKIAAATNLKPEQVTNMLANGLTVGVTGAVLGDPNALENALTSTAGQFTGYQAQNLVYDTLKSADPKVLAATASAAGNVANVATQTTINGGDVSLALQNAMPSIISDAAQAGNAVKSPTTGTTQPSGTTKPDVIAGLTPEQVAQNGYYDSEGVLHIDVTGSSEDEDELAPTKKELTLGSLFSEGTPPPSGMAKYVSVFPGSGASTDQETPENFLFTITAKDSFVSEEEKQAAIEDASNWAQKVKTDSSANNYEKTLAENIVKKLSDVPITNVDTTIPSYVPPSIFTPPVVKPPEVKPTDVKPVTTTTAGGSSTAAPTPEPTPQQKADELQKQADAAQTQVLNAANSYIQNPTPENKARASAAVLNYELAAKIADAAKADLIPKAEIPLPKDSGSTSTQPAGTPAGSQQPSQDGSQQTGSQQTSQPGSQQPAQPGSNQPSQTTSTTPGSGTSNLPGDSTSTTSGLGGIGTGGTGTVGTGTSGTGTGTGTGTGIGTDITGALSALAGALGSGKVPTVGGGLAQVPIGYTAVTTPLAKRPIGDLYPVSNIMMSPEEIAARSTTQMVRRGGLVSR